MNASLGKHLSKTISAWRKFSVCAEEKAEADHYERALEEARQRWDAQHQQVVSFATPAESSTEEAPDGRE